MNFPFLGSEKDRLDKKISKLESQKARIEADPQHSKDDLVRIDCQIKALKERRKLHN